MRPLYLRDTRSVAPDRRASAWRDWVHESVVEMELRPLTSMPFFSRIEVCQMSSIAPHQVRASAQRITRTRTEIARSGKHAYYLISQRTRPWRLVHAGRDQLVQPGQPVLVDSQRPYEFGFDQGLDDLSVELPPAWLARWLPDPDRAVGVPMDTRTPWGRALQALKEALVPEQLAALAVPDALIEDQLGTLLSLATEPGPNAPLARPALQARCVEILRARLAQPGLVAADVAQDAGLSLRALHRVFAATGDTFASTLMRLRLDEAARMLQSRRFDSLAIADIALRCGFADPSHFARAFQRARGMSPRAFRTAAQR